MKKAAKKETFKPIVKQEMLANLGARIKQLRKDAGYTNYEYFAFECKISRAQYGNYERGTDMRLGSLMKILNVLGITLEEFFSEGFD